MSNYVIEITGGLGKHLMATSFIKWLSEKYPKSKIIVISAYPEIFEYNPRIYRNLRLDQPYLFEDYIYGNDFRIGEPYNLYEYYREEDKKHIMELYPKAYRFEEYNDTPEMEIYLTKGEEIDGDVYNKQNFPLITFQPFGGLPAGAQLNRMKVDTSERDMPMELAVKIVNILTAKGFKVLQIRGPSEPIVPNTLQLNIPFRNLLPICKFSLGHIGIDSSFMHASACLKKPQMIFWGNTHKDNVGYEADGVINVYNKYCMKCRPHIQLPDRDGIYPHKDTNEELFFKYTDKEIEDNINKFVDFIKLKLNSKVI